MIKSCLDRYGFKLKKGDKVRILPNLKESEKIVYVPNAMKDMAGGKEIYIVKQFMDPPKRPKIDTKSNTTCLVEVGGWMWSNLDLIKVGKEISTPKATSDKDFIFDSELIEL